MTRTMNWWMRLALCLPLSVVSCRAGPEAQHREGQYRSVQEIVDRLREAGVACTDLIVRDAKQIAEEREAEPEPSLPTGAVRIEGPEYAIAESGMCQIEGGPQVAGQTLATTITVYQDDEHLETIPEQGFPGLALVYGDSWLVSLSHLELTEEAAEALDGRVVPPRQVPESEIEPKALAARCFFVAALPPGLKAAAAEFGESADEPQEYARLFAESAYYLPEETRLMLEQECLRGFRYEEMVRSDASDLESADFQEFWFEACAYAQSDFTIRDQLGSAGGINYLEFGRTLTDEVLESTSLTEARLEKLRPVCGRGVKQGAIGDPD